MRKYSALLSNTYINQCYKPVSQSCAVDKSYKFWRATGHSDRMKDFSCVLFFAYPKKREREGGRERETDRERKRERETEEETETERDRGRERQRKRQRKRERGRGGADLQ